jgi:hypothetical protein
MLLFVKPVMEPGRKLVKIVQDQVTLETMFAQSVMVKIERSAIPVGGLDI